MSQQSINSEAYLNTYHQLKEAVEGLTHDQLTWRPGPGKWSITEVLSHLADHNIIVSFRIREILADSTAILPRFDQDAWVAGSKANDGKVDDIIEVFRALLQYNNLLFGRLSTEDLQKTGVNFKGETITLPIIAHAFVQHVQSHLGQIATIKANYPKD